ncbi:MAG: hypothetical protein QJR09_05795 [Micrococcus sp.]|nr:hypothetical protein [Micrococcus sp.]
MGIYDIQLEQTGATTDWTLLVLCAVAGVLGLIAAVVVIPQLVTAVRRERLGAAGTATGSDGTGSPLGRGTTTGADRAAASNRVGLAMATLLSAMLVVGGIIGSVVALTATGLHHASGHVEATGMVDGQRWLKIAEMPFAVAWNGAELKEGERVGAACVEGSPVAGLDWTCAPPGN